MTPAMFCFIHPERPYRPGAAQGAGGPARCAAELSGGGLGEAGREAGPGCEKSEGPLKQSNDGSSFFEGTRFGCF